MAENTQVGSRLRICSRSVSSVRAEMASAIAECSRGYGLRLAGSWATREAHLPSRVCGVIHSLSDIDLIAKEELGPFQQREVRCLLEDTATEMGIWLKGISIRLEMSLTGLPHACGWCPAALQRFLKSDRNAVLSFWAAVAAIEAAITATREHDRQATGVTAYVGTKFFCTLIRNVALFQGDVLSSYRDVCSWVNRRWSDIPIAEVYRIKIGELLDLQPSSVDALLGDEMLYALLGSAEAATSIARAVREYCCKSVPLEPFRYAQIAQAFAPDEHAHLVLSYEMAKLDRAMCSVEITYGR